MVFEAFWMSWICFGYVLDRFGIFGIMLLIWSMLSSVFFS